MYNIEFYVEIAKKKKWEAMDSNKTDIYVKYKSMFLKCKLLEVEFLVESSVVNTCFPQLRPQITLKLFLDFFTIVDCCVSICLYIMFIHNPIYLHYTQNFSRICQDKNCNLCLIDM